MKLIETDSPLYLKRLVRELNNQEDGFYAPTSCFQVRCNRAKMKKGELWCHSYSCKPEWFIPSRMAFSDCYGREIVANRCLK